MNYRIIKRQQILAFLLISCLIISCTKKEDTVIETIDYKSIEFVQVSGGSFQMGDAQGEANTKPVHQVSLNSFQISKQEITNYQYCQFLNDIGCGENGVFEGVTYLEIENSFVQINYSNGSFSPESGKHNHPVIIVTWVGAKAFANWLGGRLASEAEWEFAARGGINSQNYIYSGSNDPNEVAWYFIDYGNGSQEVGTKKPNELGLFDMSGNVMEWCNDWYEYNYYGLSPENNPQGPLTGVSRVVRGGSWYNPVVCSGISFRYPGADPNAASSYIGFRVVK
ncbi:formylglycine-generating enzyme family protein [Lentimicrobium sp. L6]|uniref:formylglycine-generating enzyme family protein n=1 Tax=Lentimicrobium sp. L6 TaxID=2735916 RepID=UPI001552BE94|nr:formylglycine-generating enzyme family protein [Lentimicrobium sp. L6]NPD84812.1 formylglycine-generating enzyme family protein [Lentimicrobium sp. L6]